MNCSLLYYSVDLTSSLTSPGVPHLQFLSRIAYHMLVPQVKEMTQENYSACGGVITLTVELACESGILGGVVYAMECEVRWVKSWPARYKLFFPVSYRPAVYYNSCQGKWKVKKPQESFNSWVSMIYKKIIGILKICILLFVFLNFFSIPSGTHLPWMSRGSRNQSMTLRNEL